MISKEYFLKTGLFIDNNNLDSYIKLLINATEQHEYVEKHHIMPRSYFKSQHIKIDNTSTNNIRLSYYEHILAHYYLSLCTIGEFKQANIGAFMMMSEVGRDILSTSEQEALDKLHHAAELKAATRTERKIQCSKVDCQAKTESHRLALSRARDLHSTTKGKKSMYNKILDKVCFIAPEYINDYLAAGWVLGGKPLSTAAKQKIGKSNSIALLVKHHHKKTEANKVYTGLIGNKVLCVELNIIFNCIAEAREWLFKTKEIDGGQIKNCCAGARQTTGGYHWRYIKDMESDLYE